MGWTNRLPPALRHRDYALAWASTLIHGLGGQMMAVAVGWQVYAIHRNPLDLGLIGLAEFIPLPLLALPAGNSPTAYRGSSCSRSRSRSRSSWQACSWS